MVLPDLNLLPPEDEVGLRTSIRVAEESIFREISKGCIDELPDIFIICHPITEQFLNLLLQIGFVQ